MNNTTNKTQQLENNDFSIIFRKVFRYRYLFAISLFILMLVAYLHGKFATSIYRVNTKVLIRSYVPQTRTNTSINQTDFLGGFQLLNSPKLFQNEIQILKSTLLINKAIEPLNFEVTYYQVDRLNKTELYRDSPIVVVYNKLHPQVVGVPFNIEVLKSGHIKIKAKGKEVEVYKYDTDEVIYKLPTFEVNKEVKLGELISGNDFNFKILVSSDYNTASLQGRKFVVEFNNMNSYTQDIRNSLQIISVNIDATIADIILPVENVKKGIVFLDALTATYVANDLERKNYVAQNTLDYIDRQLSQISDSLNIAERKLQDFRSRHSLIDISGKAQQTYAQLRELETEKNALETQENYFEYIKKYFDENVEISDIIVPSAMGISDPLLNNLILELTQYNSQKTGLIDANQQNSPYLRTIKVKIENLKNTIIENIDYSYSTIKFSLEDINNRISRLNNELSSLPKRERELVSIERKFNLNDEIYNFLLEKRAEAQIAKASNLPDCEIIEPGKMVGNKPFLPNKKINYILAFLLGLGIPSVYLFLKEVLRDNIVEVVDIKKITDVSILGQIQHNQTKSVLVIQDAPESLVAESFRTVRTNLKFFTKSKDSQVILITSSISNEGKSFVSLNLASALALNDKKVVILGFDLRKPSLSCYLRTSSMLGLSNYLIDSVTLPDIIAPTGINGLDIIFSGEMPPNPVELIASDNTEFLFEHLKEIYDYIIIDTPPLGIVSDAYLLMDYSDVNVFITRQSRTPKKVLTKLITDISNKEINNLSIILNDVSMDKKNYKYYSRYHKKN